MSENIGVLVGKLDALTATVERELGTVREQAQQASAEIRRLTQDQERLNSEVNSINSRMQASTEQLRAELQSKSTELEKKLGDVNTALMNQERVLEGIPIEQKEKEAAERLESARADFLINSKGLFNSLTDRPVQYLCAESILRECEKRGITVDSFSGLANKNAAQEIVAHFRTFKDGTPAGDREQATWFESVGELVGKLRDAKRRLADENAGIAATVKSLRAERDDLAGQVAQLEKPEPPMLAKRRHLIGTACAVLGCVIIGVCILALIFANLGAAVPVAGLVAGFVLLAVARMNSDAHRANKLNSLRTKHASAAEKLKAIEVEAPERIKRTRAELDRFTQDMVRLQISPPDRIDDDGPFDQSLNVAEQRQTKWRNDHPEIAKVLP